jgi:hypothetical protein
VRFPAEEPPDFPGGKVPEVHVSPCGVAAYNIRVQPVVRGRKALVLGAQRARNAVRKQQASVSRDSACGSEGGGGEAGRM